MADLLRDDTDFEMLKYTEANDIAEAGLNPAILKNKKSVFNPETGTNDILLPMPSGGYTKVGEEGVDINRPGAILLNGMEYGPDTPEYQRYYPAPTPSPLAMTEAPAMGQPAATEAAPEVSPQTQIEDVQSYAQQLQEQQGAYTLEDLTAAGYSEDAIAAAGLDVAIAPPQTRTEPLTEEEVTKILSEGGSLIGGDPTLREGGSAVVTNFAFDLMVSGLRADLEEKGTSPRTIEEEIKARTPELTRQAEVYSNILFGTSAKNPLGAGALDFLTGGVMDIQEGYRMFKQSREANKDSLAGQAIGVGMMLAGVAEATGVGVLAGKLIKKGLQKIQPSLVQMGADAEQRIAQEGETLFSNPVAPLVDRGLAAAGKAVSRKAQEKGIELWHGSPADFEKFSLKFIGTGEGNQTFGRGLYFAQAREVADEYRKNLTSRYGFDEGKGGTLYKVKLNADPKDFLNWDGDFNSQPEIVQKILAPYIEKRVDDLEKARDELIAKNSDIPIKSRQELKDGLSIVDIMWMDRLSGGEIVKELTKAGVPGIRYLDEASRENRFQIILSVKGKPYETEPIFARNRAQAEKLAADYKDKGYDVIIDNRGLSDEGTRNFVVFDDELIDIVAKYGFAGFMLAAAVQDNLTQIYGDEGI